MLPGTRFVVLILVVCTLFTTGCFLARRSCIVADVQEMDRNTKTVYRYEVFGSKSFEPSSLNVEARKMYPGVFEAGGVPVVVDLKDADGIIGRALTNTAHNFILGPLHLVVPIPAFFVNAKIEDHHDVSLLAQPSTYAEFTISQKNIYAMSFWLPTSWLCLSGDGGENGKPSFTDHANSFFDQHEITSTERAIRLKNKKFEVFPVYGIVAKLKEMEDKGIINDDVVRKAVAHRAEIVEQRKRDEAESAAKLEQERQRREAEARKQQLEREEAERQRQKELEEETRRQQIEQALRPDPAPVQNAPDQVEQKPPYRLVKCEREKGSEYAYVFEVELINVTTDPIQMFGAIQYRFADTIRNMYALSYPSKDSRRLEIEFSDYSLSDNRIRGRAVVLEITPMTLAYDANTRRGKMSVRLNANQYEEARKWIRKNIETLARDKNIALTTGEIPPAAKFYLGREELKDGNVLEIEFKTE